MPQGRAGPSVEAARSMLRQVDPDEARYGCAAPSVQLRSSRGKDRCNGCHAGQAALRYARQRLAQAVDDAVLKVVLDVEQDGRKR